MELIEKLCNLPATVSQESVGALMVGLIDELRGICVNEPRSLAVVLKELKEFMKARIEGKSALAQAYQRKLFFTSISCGSEMLKPWYQNIQDRSIVTKVEETVVSEASEIVNMVVALGTKDSSFENKSVAFITATNWLTALSQSSDILSSSINTKVLIELGCSIVVSEGENFRMAAIKCFSLICEFYPSTFEIIIQALESTSAAKVSFPTRLPLKMTNLTASTPVKKASKKDVILTKCNALEIIIHYAKSQSIFSIFATNLLLHLNFGSGKKSSFSGEKEAIATVELLKNDSNIFKTSVVLALDARISTIFDKHEATVGTSFEDDLKLKISILRDFFNFGLPATGFSRLFFSADFSSSVLQELSMIIRIIRKQENLEINLNSLIAGVIFCNPILKAIIFPSEEERIKDKLADGLLEFVRDLELNSRFDYNFNVLESFGYQNRFKTAFRHCIHFSDDIVSQLPSTLILTCHRFATHSSEPNPSFLRIIGAAFEEAGKDFMKSIEADTTTSDWENYVLDYFDVFCEDNGKKPCGSACGLAVFGAFSLISVVTGAEDLPMESKFVSIARNLLKPENWQIILSPILEKIAGLEKEIEEASNLAEKKEETPEAQSNAKQTMRLKRAQKFEDQIQDELFNAKKKKKPAAEKKKVASNGKSPVDTKTSELNTLKENLHKALEQYESALEFAAIGLQSIVADPSEPPRVCLDLVNSCLVFLGSNLSCFDSNRKTHLLNQMLESHIPIELHINKGKLDFLCSGVATAIIGESVNDDYGFYVSVGEEPMTAGLDMIGFSVVYPLVSSLCRNIVRNLHAMELQDDDDEEFEANDNVNDVGKVISALKLFKAYVKAIPSVSYIFEDFTRLMLELSTDFGDMNDGPLTLVSHCYSEDVGFSTEVISAISGLTGLLSESPTQRLCALTIISTIIHRESSLFKGFGDHGEALLFANSFAESSDSKLLANEILEEIEYEVNDTLLKNLHNLLQHSQLRVRTVASKAIVAVLKENPDKAHETLLGLSNCDKELTSECKKLEEEQKLLDPIITSEKKQQKLKDSIKMNNDHRSGIATTIVEFIASGIVDGSKAADSQFLQDLFHFIVEFGIVDSSETVREGFLQAGLQFVALHGEKLASSMISLLQPYMDSFDNAKNTTELKNTEKKEEKKKKAKTISLSAATTKTKKSKSAKPKKDKSEKKKEKSKSKKNVKPTLSGTPDSWRAEGAVIFLGSLIPFIVADQKLCHLVPEVFALLIKALESYSRPVQKASANCLQSIITLSKTSGSSVDIDFENFLEKTIERLEADSSVDLEVLRPVKRGLALGVASMLQALGIRKISSLEIVEKIEDNLQDDKSPAKRIIGLLLFEELCRCLGVVFEPYTVKLFPNLFLCFGDGKKIVREETKNLSEIVMRQLTFVGVNLTLPAIIKNLGESGGTGGNQWRVKEASTKLLGSMAHLEKQVLAKFLPQIVPRLIDCFVDSHTKIRSSAKKAMKEISTVVENVELKSVSRLIIKSLLEPEKYTALTIDALQHLTFASQIDAASLALLLPLLKRGLKQSQSKIKIQSATVIGRISAQVKDDRELLLNLMEILPVLKLVLTDPIPTARGTAAKALRNLALGLLSKEEFEDIIRQFSFSDQRESSNKALAKADESMSNAEKVIQLLTFLMSSAYESKTSVERSGGANGLVEILANLEDMDLLYSFVNRNVLAFRKSKDDAVREGVLWVFVFLPSSFGNVRNKQLLKLEFNLILEGLDDDQESIRNVGLRAGKMIIGMHAATDNKLLLNELMVGLDAPSWRIKVASLNLVNELLYLISHAETLARDKFGNDDKNFEDIDINDEGGSEDDEEEEKVVEKMPSKDTAAVEKVVGAKLRNTVFSKLFIMRSDTNMSVRSAAVKVWKNFVFQTGKLVKVMLGDLMKNITEDLKSDDVERKSIASLAVGELVVKHGDRILPRVIPFLESKLSSGDESSAIEAVLCLVELLRFANEEQMESYFNTVSSMVQTGITCGEDENVRKYAAIAFDQLYMKCSELTVKKMIPRMLHLLETYPQGTQENSDVLLGLQLMIEKRSGQILPFLLPRLLRRTMTEFDVHALRDVCRVSGHALHSHLRTILAHLVKQIVEIDSEGDSGESLASILEAVEQIVKSIGERGLEKLIDLILEQVTAKRPETQYAGLLFLKEFLLHCDFEFSDFSMRILRDLINLFGIDREESIVVVRECVDLLFKNEECYEALHEEIDSIRSALKSTASRAKFSRKPEDQQKEFYLSALKSEQVLLHFSNLYKEVLSGTTNSNYRELAAMGLGDVVDLTFTEILTAKLLIKITGPLVRAAGERIDLNVKMAVFSSLGKIVRKGGAKLRALAPQLLSSCLKNISSQSSSVRSNCLVMLDNLVSLTPRVENIVLDLLKTVGNEETDQDVAADCLLGLETVFRRNGPKVSEASLKATLDLFDRVSEMDSEAAALNFSRAAGRASKLMVGKEEGLEAVTNLISDTLVPGLSSDLQSSQEFDVVMTLRLGCLAMILQNAGDCEDLKAMKPNLVTSAKAVMKKQPINECIDFFNRAKVSMVFSMLDFLARNGFADSCGEFMKYIGPLISEGGATAISTLNCLAILGRSQQSLLLKGLNHYGMGLVASSTKNDLKEAAISAFISLGGHPDNISLEDVNSLVSSLKLPPRFSSAFLERYASITKDPAVASILVPQSDELFLLVLE